MKTVYKESDFSSAEEFASEMCRYGRLYRDDPDTEVVYAKPEDEHGNIVPQFTVIMKDENENY